MNLSLFDVPPHPRVRKTDPVTSVEAARRQSGGTRVAILEAFRRFGPMTDEQLADRLAVDGLYGPTVKSARSRLQREGLVVATSRVERSRRGANQIVWALHHSLRPTEVVRDGEGRVA